MLDTAFEALKKFDWGSDLATLAPIEDAVVEAHDKPEVGKDLESRLIAALKSDLTLDGREYVCRKLAVIGTAACVPVLATLLLNKDDSHMARYALERIPASESCQALRDALTNATGNLKIGIISSLGACRDTAAVPALGQLLKNEDQSIARSAALALGAIGNGASAGALKSVLHSSGVNSPALIDALLGCAESLLAGDKRAEATDIYKAFAQDSQPRLVRLAAMRGLLACASKHA